MDKIAVLIPCYNESATIEKVVKDFKREIPEAVIYVYDNNSSDGTDEIARAAGAVVRLSAQHTLGADPHSAHPQRRVPFHSRGLQRHRGPRAGLAGG